MEIPKVEVVDLATVLGAIAALGSVTWKGIAFWKQSKIDEVTNLIDQYAKANEFNKQELEDIKVSLNETRLMHKECEDGRNSLACEIKEYKAEQDRMKEIILKHIRPDVPKKN